MKIRKKQSGCSLGAKLGPNWVKYCEKSKETDITYSFFHILLEEYILKQKVVVVQTPEWKFKASIVRNATLSGIFPSTFLQLENSSKNSILN